VNLSLVRVPSPAKINLVLRVLDRRPDGYHNIWSLMQTVGLEDQLFLHRTDEHAEVRLQCDHPGLAADRSNLVHKAAAAVLARAGLRTGVEIDLRKRIPLGAGLGGGSSNAAATIVGLVHLFGLGWSPAEMAAVGEELGSDVPFFFSAPTACVTGRGAAVSARQMESRRWVVLVNPGFPVETKWAYLELARSRDQARPLSDSMREIEHTPILKWSQVFALAGNDFEGPVFRQYPILQEIRDRLSKSGAEAALLSGSGATVFGLFGDEERARRAAATFSGTRYLVEVVPTLDVPPRPEPM
jgi:4-diphosphocytidyl-2-C-methyl-D-erythritol kinase